MKMEPVKTEPPPVKADGNDVIGYRDVMRDVEWMYDVAMGLMYVCIYTHIYILRIYVGVPGLFEFAFTFAGKGQDVHDRQAEEEDDDTEEEDDPLMGFNLSAPLSQTEFSAGKLFITL